MKIPRPSLMLAAALFASGATATGALAQAPAPAPAPAQAPAPAPAPAQAPLNLNAPPPMDPAPTAAQAAAGAAVTSPDAARPAEAPKPAAPKSAASAPKAGVLVEESPGDAAPSDEDQLPGTPPPGWVRTTRRAPPKKLLPGEARKGLLLSLGMGGAAQFASAPGLGHAGALDFDFRLGYGFGDRFQLFTDLDVQGAGYGDGLNTNSWALTLRGQTVLIGDRMGNGLSLNGGVGLGGFSTAQQGSYGGCGGYDCGYGGYDGMQGGFGHGDQQLGFVAAGGLSFDARIGRYLALSPEIFASWKQVPNPGDRKQDIATAMGLRLNLVWYLR